MKRRTQAILYYLLPAIFWALAVGGIVLWQVFSAVPLQVSTYVPIVLVLFGIVILGRIQRHADSAEECFEVAVLLGIAAYYLPSVLFLLLPAWGYLIYRNVFSFRSFLATLIGLALVAIWVGVLVYFLPDTFQLSLFISHLYRWIPTGAILLAWLGSTIARQTLRER